MKAYLLKRWLLLGAVLVLFAVGFVVSAFIFVDALVHHDEFGMLAGGLAAVACAYFGLVLDSPLPGGRR